MPRNRYCGPYGTVRFVIVGNAGKRHAATQITINPAAELAMFLDTGRV
jgi:hypothetical protein